MPDPYEVAAWRWISTDSLITEVADKPRHYTAWLRLALQELARSGLLNPQGSD